MQSEVKPVQPDGQSRCVALKRWQRSSPGGLVSKNRHAVLDLGLKRVEKPMPLST